MKNKIYKILSFLRPYVIIRSQENKLIYLPILKIDNSLTYNEEDDETSNIILFITPLKDFTYQDCIILKNGIYYKNINDNFAFSKSLDGLRNQIKIIIKTLEKQKQKEENTKKENNILKIVE